MSKPQISKQSLSSLVIEQHLIPPRKAENIHHMIQQIKQINQLKRLSSEARRFQSQGKQKSELNCFINGFIRPTKKVLCCKESETQRRSKPKKLEPINITETEESNVEQLLTEEKIEKYNKRNTKSYQSLEPLKKHHLKNGERKALIVRNAAKNSSQPKISLPSLKKYEGTLKRFQQKMEPLSQYIIRKPYLQPLLDHKNGIKAIGPQTQPIDDRVSGWSPYQKDFDKIILIRSGIVPEQMF